MCGDRGAGESIIWITVDLNLGVDRPDMEPEPDNGQRGSEDSLTRTSEIEFEIKKNAPAEVVPQTRAPLLGRLSPRPGVPCHHKIEFEVMRT